MKGLQHQGDARASPFAQNSSLQNQPISGSPRCSSPPGLQWTRGRARGGGGGRWLLFLAVSETALHCVRRSSFVGYPSPLVCRASAAADATAIVVSSPLQNPRRVMAGFLIPDANTSGSVGVVMIGLRAATCHATTYEEPARRKELESCRLSFLASLPENANSDKLSLSEPNRPKATDRRSAASR